MILAAQYYRAPFPERRFWKQDLEKMKASGLNALQLWVMWSWVESQPGTFNFEDYDELVYEAGKRELGVILSTIGELHPLWIHRVIPDAWMIDNFGKKVISSNRVEAHQGLTPGGCTDNPEVLARMKVFLEKTAERYKDSDNLLGWDCWNELRWNVQSDGLVCFCSHTLEAFRGWLKMKYQNLDGLNREWKRRYCSWEDVFPGKIPKRPYTEMMEFEAFLQWRAAQHAKFRYDTIKHIDPVHLISAHGPQPSYAMAGDADNHVMNRGNDFDIADHLDGYGCSHFPFWFKVTDEDFGVRVESTRSAADGKVMWVSELQGGAARQGFNVFPSVHGKPQQRWVWNGFGRGAKAIIFWCWRDEVFGKESSGYGLAGQDGLAEERLEMMKETGNLLKKNDQLLEGYQPDKAEVGVYFDPNCYNLEWAQDTSATRVRDSVTGYMTALERIQVPYDLVDSSHLKNIERYKVMIMPWPLVVPPEAEKKLASFVENGGTFLAEGELGAYTTTGFYRYSGQDRELASKFGIEDLGRRVLIKEELKLQLDGITHDLKVLVPQKSDDSLLSVKVYDTGEYYTPFKYEEESTCTQVLSRNEQGEVLAVMNHVGKGKVLALGSFIGRKYNTETYPDFESFLKQVTDLSGVKSDIEIKCDGLLQWRSGVSGEWRLLFVINPGEDKIFTVTGPKAIFGANKSVDELRNDAKLTVLNTGDDHKSFETHIDAGGFLIFKWMR